MFRFWRVREIVWCLLCGTREENGPGADLCARCQAAVQHAIEEVLHDE